MIDRTASNVSYRGGDEQSVFSIPFPFLESTHVRARIRDGEGKTTVLAAGTDYVVNRISEENGELILLGDALPAESVLTITRLVPLTQEILFHNQGPNSPKAMEEAADKLTMIAQQLQMGIDGCLAVPEGTSPEELAEAVAESAKIVSALRDEMGGKAPLFHQHGIPDISGLPDALAAKASSKHGHAQSDISGLAAALGKKLDADDPRLSDLAARAHASSHAAGGTDPVRPEDIGVLPAPPADGKPYLAAAGGWIEYIAPSGGQGSSGGTNDHSQLVNRDAPDQHPQTAVLHLPRDLQTIRNALAEKAARSELPSIATQEKDGLLSSADKKRIDDLPETLDVLPAGGKSGHYLSYGSGGALWKTPAQTAGDLPLMTASQKGVARIAANAGLELDGNGRLRIRADNLVGKADIESRFDGIDGRVESLDNSVTSLSSLPGRLDSLGSMSLADDAPANGKTHLRKNGAWVEFSNSGGAITGEIRLLPFRREDLPAGWYFCNGDRYALSTPQGASLNALPANMKSDWGIVVSDGSISLPNLFSAAGGYFLRPVDNASRRPGSIQEDAIRNITGSFKTASDAGIAWISSGAGKSITTGAFALPASGDCPFSFTTIAHGANTIGPLQFDASKAVPTAAENRPANIGMTPAIYLGA